MGNAEWTVRQLSAGGNQPQPCAGSREWSRCQGQEISLMPPERKQDGGVPRKERKLRWLIPEDHGVGDDSGPGRPGARGPQAANPCLSPAEPRRGDSCGHRPHQPRTASPALCRMWTCPSKTKSQPECGIGEGRPWTRRTVMRNPWPSHVSLTAADNALRTNERGSQRQDGAVRVWKDESGEEVQ